jgi:2-polyprenyl-3-methyl-5-hydroxy-6-metoxy-1,4-benzoquinol methylase
VTRPAWALTEKGERWTIALASLLVGIYAGWGQDAAKNIASLLGFGTVGITKVWPLVDIVIVTMGCVLLLRLYKKFKVRCYPATFLYCFEMPEASNPTGQSRVVGFCYIKPNMTTGELEGKGASFFWNTRLDEPSRVRFTSSVIRGTRVNSDEELTTCHIRFSIDESDRAKRLYRRGLLEFQLYKNPIIDGRRDSYAGYLQSTNKDVELQDVEVEAKGYAEWFCKATPSEAQLLESLGKSGDLLFHKLAILKTLPEPELWQAREHLRSGRINCWGHHIPTPQSVILNAALRVQIEAYLGKVLRLYGLDADSIAKFVAFAVQRASLNQDDNRLTYEGELRAQLADLTAPDKADEALTNRARIIYDEIKPFFCGETLLDIGCGNGLISYLSKVHFKKVKVLDVVKYVPISLGLDFEPYCEGQPLPVAEQQYDVVLLLTVLHHSNDPVELLKLAWAATKKRLIVIESVVGVHRSDKAAKYELIDFPDDSQIGYAAFIDWFYNRVLHKNIPVPYNFTTPDKWQATFLQQGMPIIHTVHFGQDIDIGPEYHIMFVLERP